MAGILEYALKLSTSAFTGPMGAANNALRGLTSTASTAAGVLAKMATPLAALGGAAGALAALNKAANFEQLSVSMRVLIGDSKEAEATLSNLKSFSNSTPFEFADIAQAGKTMIALGSSTKTLIPELRALGDVSSGLGIPINEIAIAYGRARADGVLYAETLNQFGDKGIAIYDMLARQLGVSTTEVKKMAAEGQITFPYLQKVLSDLTAEGGRFHGMMQEQSGTTKGLLSTLKSAFDDLLVTIGTPVNDFLKPILAANIQRMQALNLQVKSYLTLLTSASKEGRLGEFLGASLQLAMANAINVFAGGARGVVAYLGAAIPPVFEAAVDILTSKRTQIFFTALFRGMGEILSSVIKNALSNLPGLDYLSEQAGADEQRGLAYMAQARNQLGRADMGAAFARVTKGMEDAAKAGADAYKSASSEELIPTGEMRKRFTNIANELNADALKNLMNPSVQGVAEASKSLEDSLGGLNLTVEKAAKKTTTPEAAPAEMPLGGYGGELPGGRPRRTGLLGISDSLEARMNRRSAADRIKDARFEMPVTDRLGKEAERARLEKIGLGGNLINLERAASRLARGTDKMDPGRTRREEKAEAARKAADPLYRVVKSIEEKFSNIAKS